MLSLDRSEQLPASSAAKPATPTAHSYAGAPAGQEAWRSDPATALLEERDVPALRNRFNANVAISVPALPVDSVLFGSHSSDKLKAEDMQMQLTAHMEKFGLKKESDVCGGSTSTPQINIFRPAFDKTAFFYDPGAQGRRTERLHRRH